MNAIVPLAVEGVKELYNLYRGTTNGGNKLGVSKSELRMIGHYNKNGRRLAIYHK